MNKKLYVIAPIILLIAAAALVSVVIAWTNLQHDASQDPLDTGTVTQADLEGRVFVMTSINGSNVDGHYLLRIPGDSMGITICNNISGGYRITNNTLEQNGSWMSTLIGCPEPQSKIEGLFSSFIRNHPRISLSGKVLTLYTPNEKFVFTEE